MTDEASPQVTGSSEAEPPRTSTTAELRTGAARWGLALLVASVLTWGVVFLLHIPFSYPPELTGVDNFSPPAMQEKLAAKNYEILYKTSVIKFTLAGLFFGCVPLLVANWPLDGRERRFAAVGIVSGLVSGFLAALAALAIRSSLEPMGALKRFGEGDQMLVGDTMVYVTVSLLLVLPIAAALFVRGDGVSRQQAAAMLLAGLTGGGLVPIVSSFALPGEQTNIFPPEGNYLIVLWLAMISVFAIAFRSLGKPENPKLNDSMVAVSSES